MKQKFIFCLYVSLLWLGMASIAGATTYTLTLTTQGSGNIGRNPTNANSVYPSGATVTLTPIPAAGWYFANWSGDISGSLNPTNVLMDSDLSITGVFLPCPTYTLTLVTNGQGEIVLNPTDGSYYSNTVVTATATASNGWVFTGWSDATNTTTDPVALAIDSNLSLAATFVELPAIDTQPLSVTNIAGSTVSFSVAAEGAAPLGYQWYFSGGSLGLQTNTTLSLTNVTTAQQGNYWLIVTNNYGSATSHVASLTLTNALGPTNFVTSPTEASLLTAIQSGGWISFQFNGTLTLTNTVTITNNVILDGNNVSVTISGGNAVQLFNVAPGASLTLSNLTLANGYCVVTNGTLQSPSADGGAIYNNGTLIVDNCTLTNNNAYSSLDGGLARGGAVFNNGGMVLLDQTYISSNSATGGGPNSFSENPVVGTSLGGAIYNANGSLIVIGCNMNSNLSESVCEAGLEAGGPNGLSMGGAIYQAAGSVTIANSAFTSNLALGGNDTEMDVGVASPAYGGAVAIAGGDLSISYDQFYNNQAVGGAGAQGPAGPAYGGAVYCASTWTVADSTFSGNQAVAGNGAYNFGNPGYTAPNNGLGGGIYNAGTLTLNRCSIYSNSAVGGLVYAGGGTYAVGAYGQGGGIFNSSQLTATNCTIALNSAIGGDGSPNYPEGSQDGRGGSAWGGGMFNNTNATFIGMNLTIATNSCYSPATVSGPLITTNGFTAGAQIANTNGTLALHNSIIAYSGTNSNAYGTITDNGYNISSDGTANLDSGSSYNFTDPQLAALGNYGGPTMCMALQSNSPAIDFADPSDFPPVDQRGYPRPFGSGPDIGAYEYGSALNFFTPALTMTVVPGNLIISFLAVPGHTYYFQASPNLSSWINVNTNALASTSTNIYEVINEKGSGSAFFRLMVQ